MNFSHQTCIIDHVTVVCIHWMHLSVNGISAESFWPQKSNEETLFLGRCFQRQCDHV